jgi:ribosomal protein L20A (L18A)
MGTRHFVKRRKMKIKTVSKTLTDTNNNQRMEQNCQLAAK